MTLEKMIIAFEGTDGSGKGTQAKMLHDYLTSNGKKAILLDFPQYNTHTGIKIKEYLSGEKKLKPIEVAKLFYEDQLAQKEKMNELIKKGIIVILDRYTLSTQVYQGAQLKGIEREELIKEIRDWQKSLPEIDAGIFLDLPVEYSIKKVIERGRKLDIHEKDVEYMKKVYELYLKTAKEKGYYRIFCVKDGMQKSREEIFKEALLIIKEKTGLAF